MGWFTKATKVEEKEDKFDVCDECGHAFEKGTGQIVNNVKKNGANAALFSYMLIWNELYDNKAPKDTYCYCKSHIKPYERIVNGEFRKEIRVNEDGTPYVAKKIDEASARRRRSKSVGGYKVQCPHCDRKFKKRNGALKRHITRSHNQ